MKKRPKSMNEKTLELVAERFRLLADPMRLRLLNALAEGEMSVAELVTTIGAAQANVSKHLQMLHRAGFVHRRKEGLRVFYSVADPRVFEICDVVCGSLAEQLENELSAIQGGQKVKESPARAKRQRR
jgi:ArsR family transcriptional regulator